MPTPIPVVKGFSQKSVSPKVLKDNTRNFLTPAEAEPRHGPSTCASSGGAFKGMFQSGESLTSFGNPGFKPRKFEAQTKAHRQLFSSKETDDKENRQLGNRVDSQEMAEYRRLCSDFEPPSIE